MSWSNNVSNSPPAKYLHYEQDLHFHFIFLSYSEQAQFEYNLDLLIYFFLKKKNGKLKVRFTLSSQRKMLTDIYFR